MKTLVIIAIAATLASLYLVSSPSEENDLEFTQFMNEYRKSYSTETELEFRRSVFAANMKRAEIYQAENPLAVFGVTVFSDRTEAEMAQMMGLDLVSPLPEELEFYDEETQPNADIDWRKYLPPIQNQANCGSCWAFSAAATFEGRYSIKTKKASPKFSEQQLMDCVTACSACSGGLMDYAFLYLKATKFCSLAKYPYLARKDTCKATTCGGIVTAKEAYSITKTEQAHLSVLGSGPISIAVDATSWPLYKSGILTSCNKAINHGVNLVGYLSVGGYAWLVRNSWGPSWGEAGHIRLAYGANVCNLTSRSTIVTF